MSVKKRLVLGLAMLNFCGSSFLDAEPMTVYVMRGSHHQEFNDFLEPGKNFKKVLCTVDVAVGDSLSSVLEKINVCEEGDKDDKGDAKWSLGQGVRTTQKDYPSNPYSFLPQSYPDVVGLNLIRAGIAVTRTDWATKGAVMTLSTRLLDSLKSYFANNEGAWPIAVKSGGVWYLEGEDFPAVVPEMEHESRPNLIKIRDEISKLKALLGRYTGEEHEIVRGLIWDKIKEIEHDKDEAIRKFGTASRQLRQLKK